MKINRVCVGVDEETRLEPVGPRDREFLTNLRIDLDKFFGADVKTEKDAQEWFKYYGLFTENEDGIFWVIKKPEDGEWGPVGALGFNGFNDYHERAEFGRCMMSREYQGKGIFFKAAKAALDYGFDDLNLHSIELNSYTWNERAVQVYESLGFSKVGVMKDYWKKGGKFHDALLMSAVKGKI